MVKVKKGRVFLDGMKEIFEDFSEDEWKKKIASLMPEGELVDEAEDIALKTASLIEKAVLSRIPEDEPVGIFFSGGLDSSLIAAICKKHGIRFTCYTVGFQEGNMNIPEDITHAQSVAEFLELTDDEFKFKIFDLEEAEDVIKRTANILKDVKESEAVNLIVNLGVGSVEAAAHSISKKEKHFFSGLGSEEIFAGYDRHKTTPTNEECYNGLLKMHERDILRDSAMAHDLGFSFRTPFLDEELIRYALSIPIEMKLNSQESKIILRKAALPYIQGYSERPKKAAQYGSSFDKAITRLASKNGFKAKKEYYLSLIN